MSTCPIHAELSAYHDGELDAVRRASVERHLVACGTCAAELAELRSLSLMFAGADVADGPRLSQIGLHRLHAKVDAAMEQGLLRLARVLSAVAACVVLAGSMWLTHARSDGSQATRAVSIVVPTREPWAAVPTDQDQFAINETAGTPVAQWYLAGTSGSSRPDEQP